MLARVKLVNLLNQKMSMPRVILFLHHKTGKLPKWKLLINCIWGLRLILV